MRINIFVLSAFGLLLAGRHLGYGQWVQSTGLYGGPVNQLILHQGKLVAGTNGGIFTSTNGGDSWIAMSKGMGTSRVACLLAGEEEVIAANSSGVYSLVDGKDTWNNLVYDFSVTSLASQESLLFVGISHGVIRIAKNGEIRWFLDRGLANSFISALAFLGSDLFAGTTDGVFVSGDSGESWKAVSPVPGNRQITKLATVGDSLFAGTYHGLYVSPDRGGTWRAIQGITDYIFSLSSHGSTLYVGADKQAFTSTDAGSTWSSLGQFYGPVYAIIGWPGSGEADDRIYAATTRGVSRRVTPDTTWTAVNWGLSGTGVVNLQPLGDRLLATSDGGAGRYVSTDLGSTWSAYQSNLPGVTCIAQSREDLYAGTFERGVFRSTDLGVTWLPRAPSPGPIFSLYPIPVAGTNSVGLLAVTGYGLSLLGGEGDTWTFTGLTFNDVRGFFAGENGLFVASELNGLFNSTDGGRSWKPVKSSLAGAGIQALITDGSALYVGTYHGVFVSTNGGTSWTRMGLSKFSINALAVRGRKIYAASYWDGMFVTFINDSSWTGVSSGVPYWQIRRMIIAGDYLLAAPSIGGVWRRKLAEVNPPVPSSIILEQNFPNPFNPSTTIRFGLPTPSIVILTVYNILGQRITELVNGFQYEGYHDVRFNGSNLASGVYYYRIQAGEFIQTKSFLLIH